VGLPADPLLVLVDPLDTDGLDERVAELGGVRSVLVVQDRHTRDAAAVAERHGVPVGLPDWMELGREKLDATAESASGLLADTAYESVEALAGALVDEETTLQAEGLSPTLRLHPPRGGHDGLKQPVGTGGQIGVHETAEIDHLLEAMR